MGDHELTSQRVKRLRSDWPGTRVVMEAVRFRSLVLLHHGREPSPAEYYAAGEHGALAALGKLDEP